MGQERPSLQSQAINRWKGLIRKFGCRQSPPILDDGRIETAVVDRVLQVAIVKIGEGWLGPKHPAFHPTTKQNVWCGRTVVRAMTSIFLPPSPEL